jgi:hypothetical protein
LKSLVLFILLFAGPKLTLIFLCFYSFKTPLPEPADQWTFDYAHGLSFDSLGKLKNFPRFVSLISSITRVPYRYLAKKAFAKNVSHCLARRRKNR